MIVKSSMVDMVLFNYSQIELMAKYFGIPVEDIEYCLEDINNKISNPLRVDDNPSLSFMYRYDGRLVAKDWANDIYSGDVFDIIALLLELDVTNPKHFHKIYKSIISNNIISRNILLQRAKIINGKSTTIIKFKKKPFSKSDLTYWSNGGVNTKLFKIRGVYAAEYIWINNMESPVYVYNPNDPAYVYYFNTIENIDILQVYLPFTKLKSIKFTTNNTSLLQAATELYRANTLIIAKSRKDKLVIESMLYDDEGTYVSDIILNRKEVASLFISATHNKSKSIPTNITIPKFCVTSVTSESVKLSSNIADTLYKYYDNIIFYCDYDKTGIVSAFYHYKLFNFKPVFLGNNKDLYSLFDRKEIIRMFNKMLLVDNRLTLTESIFKDFIDEYSNTFEQKDLFEYVTVNGYNKGEDLINKIFKE